MILNKGTCLTAARSHAEENCKKNQERRQGPLQSERLQLVEFPQSLGEDEAQDPRCRTGGGDQRGACRKLSRACSAPAAAFRSLSRPHVNVESSDNRPKVPGNRPVRIRAGDHRAPESILGAHPEWNGAPSDDPHIEIVDVTVAGTGPRLPAPRLPAPRHMVSHSEFPCSAEVGGALLGFQPRAACQLKD